MFLLRLGLQLAVQIAIYLATAAAARFVFSFFPAPGPIRRDFETVYPVPWRNCGVFIGLGGVCLALTVYLVLSGSIWSLVWFTLAAILLLSVPGAIVTDSQGIRRERWFLIPARPLALCWDEIDSLYEKVDRTQYGSYITAIVSAGADNTIEFSPWHVGREEFVDSVESRGIPVVRARKPE